MGELAFEVESVAAVWDEAKQMTAANNEETGILPAALFDPKRELYEAMEADGAVVVLTMRLHGKLCGYSMFTLSPHPHYPSVRVAYQDVMYVTPGMRGRAALAFIRWSDDVLASLEANVAFRHVTVRRDYSKVLEAMGYRRQEVTYMRIFDLPDQDGATESP